MWSCKTHTHLRAVQSQTHYLAIGGDPAVRWDSAPPWPPAFSSSQRSTCGRGHRPECQRASRTPRRWPPLWADLQDDVEDLFITLRLLRHPGEVLSGMAEDFCDISTVYSEKFHKKRTTYQIDKDFSFLKGSVYNSAWDRVLYVKRSDVST